MAKKKNGHYWAIEFCGERVRVCRFRAEEDDVEIKRCVMLPVEDFHLSKYAESAGIEWEPDDPVLCAVPRSEVLLKPFVIPKSGDADVRNVALLKLEQSVSDLNPETTLWGFMEQPDPENPRRVQVLAGTISRAYIGDLQEKHFAGGFLPALVECGALSAVRAHLAEREEPVGCELLVDGAPDGLSIFMLQKGVIELAHFVPSGRPTRMALTEIRRVILTRSGEGEAVERVVCLGGKAAEEIAGSLRESLSIPVIEQLEGTIGGTPADSEVLPEDWGHHWHRVAGLVEYARTEKPRAINFVGAQKRRRLPKVEIPGVEGMRTSVLVLSLVALLVAGFLVHRAVAARHDALVNRVIAMGRKATADLEVQTETLERLKRFRAEQYSLKSVLFELHERVPDGVTLDSLSMNADGTFSITGRGKNLNDGQEVAARLNESEFFESADTISNRKDGKQFIFKTNFKLTARGKRARS
jgi:hypothetical protein